MKEITNILLIIPAYNEKSNIDLLIKKIKEITYRNFNIDYIVINDCSTDDTSLICKSAECKVIDLPCNLGIGGAVQTGYKYARIHNYDIAIQIDGDGQHNPNYIFNLIQPLIEDRADIVIGSRYIEKQGFQSTYLRRAGIVYLSKLIKTLSNQNITDPTSGFRACNKKVIRLFAENYPKDYPEPESIMYLLRRKLRVVEKPVIMNAREGGVSSINFQKSLYYMVKVTLAIIIDKFRKESFER